MSKGKFRRKKDRRVVRDEAPTPKWRDEPPIHPVKVQGRCATCQCGALIELEGPTREDMEKMRKGARVYYQIVCSNCVRKVLIEDPWEPREQS